MSNWASEQINRALQDAEKASVQSKPKPKGSSKRVHGESPGERSVRLVLMDAFGLWEQGGEVVPELKPFKERQFRCDFALPRWRCAVEVDGWSHHSKFLDDHHSDRKRGLYFAARDWLLFRLSHGMSVNEPGEVVDALRQVMELRTPVDRDTIRIEPIKHKQGVWYRML